MTRSALKSTDVSEKRRLHFQALCSSETSVDFQRTTRRYIPEDSALNNRRCETLKSYVNKYVKEYVPVQRHSVVASNWFNGAFPTS
jgi:hypothetical protein